MARCGDRVPWWPRTGWVPWGPAGPAPGRDFPRGCTVELFGVLCAPQVMHSASGVCPLPRPSVGSCGHGWAGHPHVPHPEHPEPPVTGRHWGPRYQHPSCTQGWGYPLPAPSPGRLLPPSASPLGIAPGPQTPPGPRHRAGWHSGTSMPGPPWGPHAGGQWQVPRLSPAPLRATQEGPARLGVTGLCAMALDTHP